MTSVLVTNPIPPVDAAIVDKWDREWMLYLSTEAKWPHLIRSVDLTVIEDVAMSGRADMFNTVLTRRADGQANAALRIWAKGEEIVGRNVAEIGCGAGFLGKQLGLVATRYLGIDVSQIAIAIARGNSPATCTYLHLSEDRHIRAEFSRYHTVVGREFFIHQNFENAALVLQLAQALLDSDGVVCADFYLPNRKIPQGVLHPARSPLDPKYASCAFLFSDQDIDDVARQSNLSVESIDDSLAEQRKFVVFRKPEA